MQPVTLKHSSTSRRDFLKTSGSALAAGLITAPYILSNVSAAEAGSPIKIGLIGCGGRGTGAAQQALSADKGVILTAVGDAFQDQADRSINALKADKDVGSRVKIDPSNVFVGLDAYRKVIDSGVDMVLLTSPPGFRPQHMKYAVEQGKHAFVEKPIATDAAGYRSFMESVKLARQKNLAVGSGFCWRSHLAQRAVYERILGGEIGDVHTIYGTYNTSPPKTPVPRQDSWGDMEYVLRNWMQFPWLSGDCLVEQAIHNVDLTNWAMNNEMPVKCLGHGGRQIRPEPLVGANYDHFSIVYEWANGTRGFIACRQITGCANDNTEHVYGSKGKAHILLFRGNPYITNTKGERVWRYTTPPVGTETNMYQIEHNELFASIRAGQPRNDGVWLANSSMMGIMGRMAAYTGQEVTWEQAVNSKETLVPAGELTFNTKPPAVELAMPGRTQLL
jgi:myo-inositol 2-dehydrogenase / D-chiro-inositol 1-dehydrogenase